MSSYRFNDTVTLYTMYDEDAYERHIIPAVKIVLVESIEAEDTRATVYIPIHGRRMIKYKPSNKRARTDKSSFTAEPNQKLVLHDCYDSYPPDSALTVRRVETHLSGSRHMQHIKLVAYNIPPKEDNDE